MATEVALTRIVHGKEDGSRIVIEEGHEVKDLPKEALEELRAAGSVGKPVEIVSPEETDELKEQNEALVDENADLAAKIAQLEKDLAAATAKAPATPAPTK